MGSEGVELFEIAALMTGEFTEKPGVAGEAERTDERVCPGSVVKTGPAHAARGVGAPIDVAIWQATGPKLIGMDQVGQLLRKKVGASALE